MHSNLRCTSCSRDYDPELLWNECTECSRPLYAEYPLERLRSGWSPEDVARSADRSMWRFSRVLPIDDRSEAVSLGEGSTPLLQLLPRSGFESWTNLWVKDESFNPTGSFKARGMAAAVTRAAKLGVRQIALPSAGNAAGAAASYCARAGIECVLFVPKDTPPCNVIECQAMGASIFLVDGLISDAGRLARAGRERFGWFDVSTLKEPFRVEGKKIMGYELALDMARILGRLCLPDVIVYPAGGGTGLVGMWKAFAEMEALGWIGPERPRMVAVQASGCDPIVRAFEKGERFAEPIVGAHTIASGLRVPGAIGDFLMLDAIRQSGGCAVRVDDEQLMAAMAELCHHQGVSACPEGGAAWAAARRLRDLDWLSEKECVVLFNTGSNLKYQHLEPTEKLHVLDPGDDDWSSVVERELGWRAFG